MVAVVGVFALTTAPLAVVVPTTVILRSYRVQAPALVVLVVWTVQLLRTVSNPVLYGVCNTMFASCMLRLLRCQGPLRHAAVARLRGAGSQAARPLPPGSGNHLVAGEVDQNEEISTIAPLPLVNCHCPLCPQCNGGVQQSAAAGGGAGQQWTTSATTPHGVQAARQSTGEWSPAAAGAPAIGHGCKLSSCSHCSLGGRYSSRSSVPTIFRMQLSQQHRHRSTSNCSQTSQMMVGGRTPGLDSGRSSFSQRALTQSSSSSSSSAATTHAAAVAVPSDVSSSLGHYIYEHCTSAPATLVYALLCLRYYAPAQGTLSDDAV